jgi:hypothetical protein
MSNICWLFVKKLKNKKIDSPTLDESIFLYILFPFMKWDSPRLAGLTVAEGIFKHLLRNPHPDKSGSSFQKGAHFFYFSFLIAAWAAANLATGTLYGLHDT